jgi:hypothetical protein
VAANDADDADNTAAAINRGLKIFMMGSLLSGRESIRWMTFFKRA